MRKVALKVANLKEFSAKFLQVFGKNALKVANLKDLVRKLGRHFKNATLNSHDFEGFSVLKIGVKVSLCRNV